MKDVIIQQYCNSYEKNYGLICNENSKCYPIENFEKYYFKNNLYNCLKNVIILDVMNVHQKKIAHHVLKIIPYMEKYVIL